MEIELSKKDLHNLYDLFYIIRIDPDMEKDLIANNLYEWFYDFFQKLEDEAVPELKIKKDL